MAGILSTVARHFKPFNSPAVAANLKTSTFSPRELVEGRCTVYLVLPVENLRSHSGLLRLWHATIYRGIVKCGPQEERLVHLLVDEAGVLGHMDAMDDALNIGRGFGIRLKLIYQNIAQLKKCWPDAEQTVHGSCTEVFFGVSDPDTSRYVSERLGEETIRVDSGGGGGGTSWQPGSRTYSENQSWSWQHTGRKLLTPAEVERLPRRTAITFHPGCPPIMTRLVRYYERAFKAKQGRKRPFVGALFESVLLLAAAVLVAVVLTQMAGEAPPSSGVTQPSGSADPFTSDFWQMR
jgi:type IV secretion system protein VirD4